MTLTPIGHIRNSLARRSDAPRQTENAPEARIEILPEYAECLHLVEPGEDYWILTFLHQAVRTTHQVHPGRDPAKPLTGVFATRAPDRPNPIGLHRAKVLAIDQLTLHIDHMEAIDGTPVVDIKPVLHCSVDY
jgi:tRNA-Thr(GGU) m(6)t(6)A37 methyltransferase TsaA